MQAGRLHPKDRFFVTYDTKNLNSLKVQFPSHVFSVCDQGGIEYIAVFLRHGFGGVLTIEEASAELDRIYEFVNGKDPQ